MFEIIVTCKDINSSELLKKIIETAKEEHERVTDAPEIYVDADFMFNFSDTQFIFQPNESKMTGSEKRIYFELPEHWNIEDMALSYGKFVNFLMKHFSEYIEMIRIGRDLRKKSNNEKTH